MGLYNLMSTARIKLFNVATPLRFDPGDTLHVFTVFAQRVLLELGSGEASQRMARDSVTRHLRILYAVTGDVVDTDCPPEPVLAIAAALSLTQSVKTYALATQTLLKELVLKDLNLNRGVQGQLYCRLLLTMARDFACYDPHATVPFSFIRQSTPHSYAVKAVPLISFLTALLGAAVVASSPELELYCVNRWVNFTHFEQLLDNMDEFPESMLLSAWCSGTAFQCSHGQPVIDGLLVVYHGDLTNPFDLKGLELLSYQTKLQGKGAFGRLVESLVSPFILEDQSPSQGRRKPEHVVILFDLCATANFCEGGSVTVTYEKGQVPTTKSTSWGGYANSKDGEQEPKRFCIEVRGHGKQQFHFLKHFDENTFHALVCNTIPNRVLAENNLEATLRASTHRIAHSIMEM